MAIKEITLEQIKEAIKNAGLSSDLDIKDLAKIASAVNNGQIVNPEKKGVNATIGTKWEIALQNYPDFAIKRITPKTEQLLVIMPSCKGYYIKQKKGKSDEIIEQLTEDLYCKFTAGMPNDLKFDDDMWIDHIESGKKFYEKFKIVIKDDAYIAMLKAHCAKKYENLSVGYSDVRDSSVTLYKNFPQLYKEYYNDEFVNNRFFSLSNDTLKQMVDKFGLSNMRDYIEENKLSLIQNARWGNTVFGSYRFPYLLRDFEFHYAEFKDYTLYQSVFMGYGQSMDKFWDDWYDDLSIQKTLYGRVKVKYPQDLPLHHQQLAYKSILYKTIIDENKLRSVVNKLSKYDMQVDEYVFMCPKSKEDITDEAQQQCNCLAGYVERYINGQSNIFFMRKYKDKETSYITIETGDEHELRQI